MPTSHELVRDLTASSVFLHMECIRLKKENAELKSELDSVRADLLAMKAQKDRPDEKK